MERSLASGHNLPLAHLVCPIAKRIQKWSEMLLVRGELGHSANMQRIRICGAFEVAAGCDSLDREKQVQIRPRVIWPFFGCEDSTVFLDIHL
jgi:hypothetical protein